MRLIWTLLVFCLVLSSSVTAIGMGMMTKSSTINLDVGDEETIRMYFRGSDSEGTQTLKMFMETSADGVSFNGVQRSYEKVITVKPNENTYVDVDVKGLKAGTYAVKWGQYSIGSGGGFSIDARGQSAMTIIVKGESSSGGSSSSGGGGGGGAGGSAPVNVTSACNGKYELRGASWVCVAKNVTTNVTVVTPVPPQDVPKNAVVQDVAMGEGGIAQIAVDTSVKPTMGEKVTETVDAVTSAVSANPAKSVLMIVLGIGLLAIVLQGVMVYYARRNS